MKTFLSLIILATATIGYSQNEQVAVQQQVIQYNNSNTDNNIGNYNINPSILNNRSNVVSRTNVARVQQVQSRGSRGNRRPTSNLNVQQIQLDNVSYDNVESNIQITNPTQNKEIKQEQEAPQINLNLNVNLNLPTVNLNRSKEKEVKEEKVAPKRLDDFRIKTGSSSSSGGTSHKSKKEKRSFAKKVVKPIKCWIQRTFKHNTKFHFSCECFKF